MPGALLGVEAVRGPGDEGGGVSLPYDAARGLWLEDLSRSATLWQRWTLPPGLRGRVEVESVELMLDMDAAGWSPRVVVMRDGRAVEIDAAVDASGRSVVTLTGDTLPEADADGGFTAGVRVTPGAGGADARPWTLRRMSASPEVRGE